MSREELQAASSRLREAAGQATEDTAEERLYQQSRDLAELATADRGPDHGRLARIEQTLTDVADDTDPAAVEEIEAALSHIRDYRETVDGV